MDLLTTMQAAKTLGISPRTLETMRLTGNGPTYVKVGRLVRYPMSHLEEWLFANQRISTTAKSPRALTPLEKEPCS